MGHLLMYLFIDWFFCGVLLLSFKCLHVSYNGHAVLQTSESSSGSEPATEIDSESKPAGASRTKRKVQPLSSEEEPTNSKTSTDEASASEQEGRTRTRTKARKLEVTASQKETGTTPTVEVLKSAKDSTTVKKDNSSGSEGSDIDRRRTQTKSRKGDEQLVSKEFSSDEVVDTEGTDGSVFYSPTANSSLQSSRRLSGHSSVKSSSTVDSGASTKSVTDDARGVCAADSTSVSVAAPVTDSGDQDVVSKPEESSRRETRVIRRAETHANDSAEGAEEEALPARSTRTKTRQMQNKAAESEEPTRPQEDEPRMTRWIVSVDIFTLQKMYRGILISFISLWVACTFVWNVLLCF